MDIRFVLLFTVIVITCFVVAGLAAAIRFLGSSEVMMQIQIRNISNVDRTDGQTKRNE